MKQLKEAEPFELAIFFVLTGMVSMLIFVGISEALLAHKESTQLHEIKLEWIKQNPGAPIEMMQRLEDN